MRIFIGSTVNLQLGLGSLDILTIVCHYIKISIFSFVSFHPDLTVLVYRLFDSFIKFIPSLSLFFMLLWMIFFSLLRYVTKLKFEVDFESCNFTEFVDYFSEVFVCVVFFFFQFSFQCGFIVAYNNILNTTLTYKCKNKMVLLKL